MSSDTPRDDELSVNNDLTDLVAYLDGELEEPAAELMERRLIDNDPLRRMADSLDQTWSLLDSLEDVAASGDFSKRTLSSLSVIEMQQDSGRSTFASRMSDLWSRAGAVSLIGWAVFGFLIASVGLMLGRGASERRRDSTDAQILQQLPVLENYHHYRVIPDVTFLQDLSLSDRESPSAEDNGSGDAP